ncbi:hypothetical protein [Thalassobacillus sp. CUG 92003]|uniref:hypothetical protein n=1 Tax=Thalassobacillus sp. CUG 92003 TaxID=2736641 RepID=UPI0015E64A73|nr:hypothetical protein [Thalassobacillus sp. CUG 92003]
MQTAEYTLADTGLKLSDQEIKQLTHEEEYWYLNGKFAQAIKNVEAYYRSQAKIPEDLYSPYLKTETALV